MHPSKRKHIPPSVIAVVADALSGFYWSHSKLTAKFIAAGAPGETPGGNLIDKSTTWLNRVNESEDLDAFEFLGELLQPLMDMETEDKTIQGYQASIRRVLTRNQLRYALNGIVCEIPPTGEDRKKEPSASTIESFHEGLEDARSRIGHFDTTYKTMIDWLFDQYFSNHQWPLRKDFEHEFYSQTDALDHVIPDGFVCYSDTFARPTFKGLIVSTHARDSLELIQRILDAFSSLNSDDTTGRYSADKVAVIAECSVHDVEMAKDFIAELTAIFIEIGIDPESKHSLFRISREGISRWRTVDRLFELSGFVTRKAAPTENKTNRLIRTLVAAKVSQPKDAFICHASEDKETIARPIYKALTAAGALVWFDEFELLLGDSLRRKIDSGLLSSRYGVVLLSHNFFSKEWPQSELDGLIALESDGRKVILPVWAGLTKQQVIGYSPVLAGRYAARWEQDGLKGVVEKILQVIKPR